MLLLRLIGFGLLLVMLFVSSGAALYEHERLEHRAFDAAPAEIPSVAAPSRTPQTAISKTLHDPSPRHGDDDCIVCFQLLHFTALVALILWLVALIGRRLAIAIADPAAPVSATIFSPRSSRGPPLAPAC